MLASKAWDIDLIPRTHIKMPGMVTNACLSPGESGTRGFPDNQPGSSRILQDEFQITKRMFQRRQTVFSRGALGLFSGLHTHAHTVVCMDACAPHKCMFPVETRRKHEINLSCLSILNTGIAEVHHYTVILAFPYLCEILVFQDFFPHHFLFLLSMSLPASVTTGI